MKTVLITGISRGIGKALAQKFLKEGYFVVGTSTSGRVSINHKSLSILGLDLSKTKSISECVKKIANQNRNIDMLINNAGVAAHTKGELPIDIKGLRKTLEVNLIGTIDFTESIIPLLNNNGTIVNISSRYGSISSATDAAYPDYRISKAALNMFTKVLASRLKNKVKVISVHPGWVKTDMGGKNADIHVVDAAKDIYNLINSKVKSGNFYFKDRKIIW